jgi:elongation factor Ts
MTNITAGMVKELREITGAGMMDCKKALMETSADIEASIDLLRKKGLAQAAKKSGRTAAEGLIGVSTKDGTGALVEVNSETDFVARNPEFQAFAKTCSSLALESAGDLEKLLGSTSQDGQSVTDTLSNLVAKIGENMTVRRTASLAVSQGVLVSYVHNAVAPDLGKIGVLVALNSSADTDKLAALGKQLAMHVAATNPLALDVASLDPDLVARERAILVDQARESGKPENVIEKMIEGRMRKFYEESVLRSQVFVIDGETRIEKVLENAGKELGAPVEISGYVRFAVGEGIEKPQEDFAAEVNSVAGS